MPHGFVGRAPISYLGEVSVEYAGAATNTTREVFNMTQIETSVPVIICAADNISPMC